MRLLHGALLLSSIVGVVVGAIACNSPVQDEAIAALGDEVPGVRTGEFHRYGQDCMVCHGGYGPGPTFAAAGTVFATPDDDIPVACARVTITDSVGQPFERWTNCAGNFYVNERDPAPQYPLRVEVACPDSEQPGGGSPKAELAGPDRDGAQGSCEGPTGATVVMGSRINREGGCSFCHANDVPSSPSSTSPGQVYCAVEQPNIAFGVPPSAKGGQCEGGPSHGSAQ